jgi:1-acyl-sn-glycerol-3-phosphate acyltransferase
MSHAAWHPHAADQGFGARIAADEQLIDQLLSVLDAARRQSPRPAAKAPVEDVPSADEPAPAGSAFVTWVRLLTEGGADTAAEMARALDAASEIAALFVAGSASDLREDADGATGTAPGTHPPPEPERRPDARPSMRSAARHVHRRPSTRGPVAYRMAKAALTAPLRLAYQLDVQGLENLPEDGGVILAANHRSFMDSIFIAAANPQPVAFLAKAEYFDRPITRFIFTSTGQIPLRRGSPVAAREALSTASGVLAEGGTLGIYPEGTRSRDGKLHRGNLGPARLAAQTGAAIVPVGLIGTEHVQLPTERVPHPFRRVTVRYGPPRHLSAEQAGGKVDLLRDATDTLMHDIANLSGQEYDDHFA